MTLPSRPAWRVLLCALCLIFSVQSELQAQQLRSVTGIVVDATNSALEGATVVALQSADSTLVSFGTTNSEGKFILRRLRQGDYLLQITFVGYATLSSPFKIVDSDLELGEFILEESTTELDELTISADHIPMLIKSDTLEYNANAFSVRPNANVEELLRKLPGIEVDRDGGIKAQGEDVEKVLVDGKEFFGDDPKIATRNLPADAVDRVQVFDKQSDMSEFTGVDDGNEQKTINLQLNENSKNGYFGNITGGYGPDNRYDGKLNVNRFSPKMQLSALGNLNNINRQSFSFGDYINFMGGMQSLMFGRGGADFSGVPVGGGATDGISTTTSGGINFNYDFSSRTSLRSSYFVNYLDNNQERTSRSQQLVGSEASSLVESDSDQDSENFNHRLNANLKHKISDGQDLSVRATLRASDASVSSLSNRNAYGIDEQLQNDSRTTYSSNGDDLGGDATLVYRKRLGTSGRSLVSETSSRFNDSSVDGNLNSLNSFYEDGDLLTSEELDQLQNQQSENLTLSQEFIYTEPLGRKRYLQFSAEGRQVKEIEEKEFLDIIGENVTLNEELSSEFDRTYSYARGGATLRVEKKSFDYAVGTDVQASMLKGTVVDEGATISSDYFHVLPNARFNYNFSQSRSLEVRYRSGTREPSIRDLQPFVDNTDPLNVYVGNPDLKPEFAHNLNGRFMLFDQFSFTNFFVFVRAGYTQNKIVSSRTIDEQLRQTWTRVNRDGDWNLAGNISFGTPIRKLGMKINLRTATLYNRSAEYINNEESRNSLLRQSLDTALENRNKAIVDIRAGTKLSLNVNRYSLNEQLNQQYINKTVYADASLSLGDNWVFSTALDYQIFSKEVFGSAQDIPLWEAEIARNVLQQRAQIKLAILDILDKDIGVNYSSSGSYFSEDRVNSLGRYLIFRFVYNLSGVNSGRDHGTIDIRG